MKKIVLLNLLVFLLLMGLYIALSFTISATSNGRFGNDAGIIYVLFIVLHLFINYLLMHRKPFTLKQILAVSLGVAIAWLIIILR